MVIDDNDDTYNPYSDEEDGEYDENNTNLLKEDKLKQIENIVLKCFNKERASNYDTWWRVGACLKNVGKDQLFDVFDKFSQKADNYKNTEECLKYWNGFKRGGLNEATLHYWAKMDNIEEWKELKSKDIDSNTA